MIDEGSFHNWKKDPVTKALFNMLQIAKQDMKEDLLDPKVIMDPECARIMARGLGAIEAFDLVLDIDIDSVNQTEE